MSVYRRRRAWACKEKTQWAATDGGDDRVMGMHLEVEIEVAAARCEQIILFHHLLVSDETTTFLHKQHKYRFSDYYVL